MNHQSSQKSRGSSTKNVLPVLCAVVVLAAAATVAVPSLFGEKTVGAAGIPLTDQGSDVEILLDDLSGTAGYYNYDAGGVTVQMFALKDDGGTVRLALNTCQVCNGSPYAYFVQEGDSFICQNCRNSFDSSRIGIESGGCNPVPITGDDYTVEDGRILVSPEFLDENAVRFTNWKKF